MASVPLSRITDTIPTYEPYLDKCLRLQTNYHDLPSLPTAEELPNRALPWICLECPETPDDTDPISDMVFVDILKLFTTLSPRAPMASWNRLKPIISWILLPSRSVDRLSRVRYVRTTQLYDQLKRSTEPSVWVPNTLGSFRHFNPSLVPALDLALSPPLDLKKLITPILVEASNFVSSQLLRLIYFKQRVIASGLPASLLTHLAPAQRLLLLQETSDRVFPPLVEFVGQARLSGSDMNQVLSMLREFSGITDKIEKIIAFRISPKYDYRERILENNHTPNTWWKYDDKKFYVPSVVADNRKSNLPTPSILSL